jgi:hypothetical protein
MPFDLSHPSTASASRRMSAHLDFAPTGDYWLWSVGQRSPVNFREADVGGCALSDRFDFLVADGATHLRGYPATKERGGICIPWSTTEPAATSEPVPTTAWLRTVAFIPIRQSSSIMHPCTTAPWPIVTLSPTVHGASGSAWSTALSWTLVSRPMRMAAESARTEAP